MNFQTDYIIITDIGSTTTKAILLTKRQDIPRLLALSQSATTVEKPVSDVRYGVYRAIRDLEQVSGIKLMDTSADEPELAFSPDVTYLSTSSAGGGLQILVIGLTLFDSASSARRAAYGAGGVILDTFAIDDTRQAMQQMLAMRNLHPDMILICGGTDGGAVSGVLRLAEIVRIAAPEPKFDTANKIPAIYAGNREAAPMIERLISADFDLHILPNLRPTMHAENLQPTQDMIQRLFMENVMKHAPGYSRLVPLAASGIIPTPLGVQKSLSIATGIEARNIFAFDIGGATTDVFSYVNTHFHRTVSANLGMSYSAMNVLKECGLENIMRWLPGTIDEDVLRNYIANKTLHPNANPCSESDYRIEHAIAREALSMALLQHRQMHFNTVKVGFLDKLRKSEREKFEMIFEYAREEEKYCFSPSDVDVLIGAGGIFAHALNPEQCALVLIDAFQPRGITEVWIDRHFITPQLGVLSSIDQKAAEHLLSSECIERVAIHVAPLYFPKHSKAVLNVTLEKDGNATAMQIMPDEFHYLPGGHKRVRLETVNGASLGKGTTDSTISTDLPLIIDTRSLPHGQLDRVEEQLHPYDGDYPRTASQTKDGVMDDLSGDSWLRRIKLAYRGEINVVVGDRVRPGDVVALNRFNPPRLYILDSLLSYKLDAAVLERSMLIKAGDLLDVNDVYARIPDDIRLPYYLRHARKQLSPVRGRVELVNEHTGIVVLSEIQDYAGKPVTIDMAERLGVPPKTVGRYMTKKVGDFVYRNELIAKRIEMYKGISRPALVPAPITGTITDLDQHTGCLTIAYLHQPMEFRAHVHGEVMEVKPEEEVVIRYTGRRLEGKIGFGSVCHGEITIVRDPEELTTIDLMGKVTVLAFAPHHEQIKLIARSGAAALVCDMIPARQLVAYLGFEPGVINTGNESIPMTLLIMGGFGDQSMPQRLMDILSSASNCMIDPHTRIRAGVVRPFICLM